MKKIITFLLSIFLLFGNTFAQVVSTLPYANTAWYSVGVQHFLPQHQISAPYTQSQCLNNGGIYKDVRKYLPWDINSDGRKDYGRPYYLSDNFTVIGDSNTRYAHLISADLSNVYYYIPQSSSNMFTLWYNNINYPLSTNHLRYRQSKIVPVNQWVRAVSSEPAFFQAPSTTTLSDRMIQVAYQITYRSYRSKGTTLDNNYQFFPIQDRNDFSTSLSSWYLNASYNDNWWQWPKRQQDYTQTNNTISTPSITWWDPNLHGLECINYHLSRCGDGYIDVSGQQPTNGSSTQPHIISDSGVSEACDPGANLSSYTDDIMPGGAAPTATYNCTATCTLNNVPTPTLTIDKQQRLLPSGSLEGIGLNTPSTITYTSPAQFEFKIIITNTSSVSATNVVMNDTLPEWFTVNSCAGTVWSTAIACNAQSGRSLTSQVFTLQAWQSATFTVIGTLTNTQGTLNSVYASYTANGTIATTPTDSVNQIPQSQPPVFALTKEVKNVTLAWQFYQADTQWDAVAVSGWHTIQYKLTVAKSWWPVTQSVKVTDTFPTSWITLTSLTVAWVAQSLPVSNPFDIIIPASAFASTNTVEILMNATVSPSASANAYVNQSLLYYGSSGVPVDAGIDNNAWVSLQPGTPKLDIDKTFKDANGTWVDQIPRTPGQSFEMKLEVTNIGSSSAPDVFVRDLCDNRISCTSYSYYYSTSPTTIIPWWNITNNLLLTPDIAPINGLAPGQKIIIIVQWSVLATTAWGITIPNTVGVYDQTPNTDGSNAVDTDPASIVTPILNKDFEIIKTGSGTLNPGSVVTYTFRIRNVGQDIISAYILTDPLPAWMTYIPGTTKINGVLNSLYDPSISNGILTRWCASWSNQLNSTWLCPLSVNGSGSLSFDARVNQ